MRKGFFNLVVLSIVPIVISACSTKSKYTLFQGGKEQSKETKTEEYQSQPNFTYEYKIAPNDRLSVVVFRHPELSTKKIGSFENTREGVLVSKNGTIVLPLIGEVKVLGMTKDEVQALLTEKYKKYLRQPEIYVEILNQRVYVLGEVSNPGVVPIIDEKITLVEALAKAGDMNFYGRRNKILIIRGDLRHPQIIKVDLTNLDSIRKAPMFLMPNDIVYVPPNKMREVNVVINEMTPPLRLISDILNPFVQIKYLRQ